MIEAFEKQLESLLLSQNLCKDDNGSGHRPILLSHTHL